MGNNLMKFALITVIAINQYYLSSKIKTLKVELLNITKTLNGQDSVAISNALGKLLNLKRVLPFQVQ
jgi:hypothetical protein